MLLILCLISFRHMLLFFLPPFAYDTTRLFRLCLPLMMLLMLSRFALRALLTAFDLLLPPDATR